MALINIELSEVTSPVYDNIRAVQDEIISRLLKLSFNELDNRYTGFIWCLKSRVYVSPGPYLNFRINLELDENMDFNELSYNVQNTFKKHWDKIMKERKNCKR